MSKPKPRTDIHPCKCKEYNGGQCYNCLNGAHHICVKKCKTKTTSIGLVVTTRTPENAAFAKAVKSGKSPTNDLTQSVIDFMNLKGNYVWRNNNITRGKHRNVIKKGKADIIGMLSCGIHIEIEIKNAEIKERLSQEQKEHGALVLLKEGFYVVIRSLGEIIEMYEHICARDYQVFELRLAGEKTK